MMEGHADKGAGQQRRPAEQVGAPSGAPASKADEEAAASSPKSRLASESPKRAPDGPPASEASKFSDRNNDNNNNSYGNSGALKPPPPGRLIDGHKWASSQTIAQQRDGKPAGKTRAIGLRRSLSLLARSLGQSAGGARDEGARGRRQGHTKAAPAAALTSLAGNRPASTRALNKGVSLAGALLGRLGAGSQSMHAEGSFGLAGPRKGGRPFRARQLPLTTASDGPAQAGAFNEPTSSNLNESSSNRQSAARAGHQREREEWQAKEGQPGPAGHLGRPAWCADANLGHSRLTSDYDADDDAHDEHDAKDDKDKGDKDELASGPHQHVARTSNRLELKQHSDAPVGLARAAAGQQRPAAGKRPASAPAAGRSFGWPTSRPKEREPNSGREGSRVLTKAVKQPLGQPLNQSHQAGGRAASKKAPKKDQKAEKGAAHIKLASKVAAGSAGQKTRRPSDGKCQQAAAPSNGASSSSSSSKPQAETMANFWPFR